ncbi:MULTISPECIES: restriction endonuclease [unclassified Polaromonas]|uniref:restriction endonuclease n=1 Tax=unclassified Polaromonas TaxID=2638319 RepID=UPI0018CB580C|nr:MULTISPECIES: restriction endonuclease [unclassified Polaromonas]MBG6073240.1 restriction system protein [Polaromonas sp. CG_9.7]MBG6115250.1 restriction system protein [Polaromonas sp. CG_9.2]MDH6183476.1 restriction system protein [Polaromonas sp. CG_23.6]
MELREKQGWPNTLMGLAARLPWWLGLALAGLTYLGLHHLAQKPLGTLQLGQLGGFVLSAVTHGLALAGQYLLPLFFGIGALLSAFQRGKATRLHAAAASRPDAVDSMNWQEFEILVGEYFRRQGYGVTDNGGGGADGGVDVVLQSDDGSHLVQCKHWRALRVGVQPVRELYGVMAAHGATSGFVVTSGEFTEDAQRFADGLALTLINGSTLLRGIRAQAGSVLAAAAPADLSTPDCPVCGAEMVLRQARSGANAGKQFWGCSRYAQNHCRGTRELD